MIFRRLRRTHSEIVEILIQLIVTDLLKDEKLWEEKILRIKQKFTDEERFAAVKSNMRTWAIHWDHQLYKALQLQFQWNVENFHSQIPIINVQLIFK